MFDGALVVIWDCPLVEALRRRAQAVVEGCFDDTDPETLDSRTTPDDYRKRASTARKAVTTDPEIDALWSAVLTYLGYDQVHRDRLRLRVVPSSQDACGRFVRPLPPHRDSWGSGVAAQINWWTPLYPLCERRTMVIWPDLFRTPVANTTDEWNYDVLMSGQVKDYPLLPVARTEPTGAALPVVIPPGSLLAFSAAHLHGSCATQVGRSRLSLDTRTVWRGDIAAGRAAPMVDGAPTPPRWEMFDRWDAAATDL